MKQGEQDTHRFWILGAICDVLSAAIQAKLKKNTNVIDIAKVSSVLLDLLRSQGPNILNNLNIPKFAHMFILLMKLDNSCKPGKEDGI